MNELEVKASADSRYASRKFVLVVGIVALGTVLHIFGHLGDQLVDLMKWVTGLYLGFNVAQKAGEWITSKVNSL